MARPSHRRHGLEVVLEVSLLCSASGCSYAFVHGPSTPTEVAPSEAQEDQRARTSCTTSNALPILGGASQGSCSGGYCVHLSSGEAFAIGAVLTGLGALALGSAVTGYGRTADCRRSEQALPGSPHPSTRHLLDLNGISEARARSE